MTTRPPRPSDRREPRLAQPAIATSEPMPRLRPMRDTGQWRHEPPERGSGWGRGLLYGTLAVLGLVVAAVAFVLVAAPTDLIRAEVAREVKARSGRDLVVEGPVSLVWVPSFGIKLANVTLSAPPGMGGPPTLRTAGLEVQVRLMPLLGRKVEVERLVLVEPVLDLRIDAAGRRSWDLAGLGDPDGSTVSGPVRLAQAGGSGVRTDTLPPELKDFVRNASDPQRARGVGGGGLAGLAGLSLGDVRLERATIRYSDARSGIAHEVTPLDATLKLPSLAGPLSVAGAMAWRGEHLQFKLRIAALQAILEERSSRLELRIDGAVADLSYEGDASLRGGLAVDGQLKAATPASRALATWLGAALPSARGLGPASVSGAVKATASRIELSSAVLALGETTANGTLAVEMSGPRPLVSGDLRMAALDLDAYLSVDASAGTPSVPVTKGPPATEPAEGAARGPVFRGAAPPPHGLHPPGSPPAPSGQTVAPSGGGSGPAPPRSIDDLLKRSDAVPSGAPTRVLGFTRRDGWREETIDLAALGLVDANLRIAAGRVALGQIALGRTQMTILLKDRQLRTTFDEVQLYEGRGRGFVTVDADTATPTVGANIQLDGVAMQPLLREAADLSWLAGRGRVSLALASRGQSERQLVEGLAGKVDVAIANGAVVGWNVGQMLRGLGQGRFAGFDKVPTERTDFSELTASFQIASGVAQNKDLRMLSPLLRVTGAGSVDLGKRRIDYVARPKVVATTAGQGGGIDLSGIEVPVKIVGSLDGPQIAPDVDALVKDPNQAAEVVKQVGRQLRDGKLGDVLKGLLGGR